MRTALVSALVLSALACGHPELRPITEVPPVMTMPKPEEAAPVTKADGTLGPWTTERPLPTARANHCAAAFEDQLVVAGGNYKPVGAADFVTLDDVQIARVASDGGLLPWRRAGSLPGPATECVLAVQGNTLVLLGGLFADSTMNARVWTATFSTDGVLGAWSEVGTLPYGRRALSGGALLRGSRLWLSDAKLSTEGPAEAVLASATLDNTLSEWRSTPYAMSFRGKPQVAFTDEAAFVIGGYGDQNAVQTSVTAIPLSESAAPVDTTPLPGGRTFGAAAAADGWLFVTGGRTQILGVLPEKTVWVAKATGASVGPWVEREALPEARSNHTVTLVGDHLFVAGGGAGAGGLDTVFRTRVKKLPPVQ